MIVSHWLNLTGWNRFLKRGPKAKEYIGHTPSDTHVFLFATKVSTASGPPSHPWRSLVNNLCTCCMFSFACNYQIMNKALCCSCGGRPYGIPAWQFVLYNNIYITRFLYHENVIVRQFDKFPSIYHYIYILNIGHYTCWTNSFYINRPF